MKFIFEQQILPDIYQRNNKPYYLDSMFNLAEHFKVQMICLTHITQNDVIKFLWAC